MIFTEGHIFHIYNQGNNRQRIFFKDENYLYFLKKVRKNIFPCCDILSYSLMPSHFRFMIHANKLTVSTNEKGKNFLSEGFRHLLSSYCKAINVQENRTGSLFRQNTQCKKVDDDINQLLTCFLSIHQNPRNAGLVRNLEDWKFSSFRDYCGFRNGTLCNKDKAIELMNLSMQTFYQFSYVPIPHDEMKRIF